MIKNAAFAIFFDFGFDFLTIFHRLSENVRHWGQDEVVFSSYVKKQIENSSIQPRTGQNKVGKNTKKGAKTHIF